MAASREWIQFWDHRTFGAAEALMDSNRAHLYCRRLATNTYMERSHVGRDAIDVRYHSTVIVRYHRSGGTQLFTGGWRTVTTRQRINELVPARGWGPITSNRACKKPREVPGYGLVYRDWAISGETIGHTPTRIIRCGTCAGLGVWAKEGQYTTHVDPLAPCWYCEGTGKVKQGGHPIYMPFYEGIMLDRDGRVAADNGR